MHRAVLNTLLSWGLSTSPTFIMDGSFTDGLKCKACDYLLFQLKPSPVLQLCNMTSCICLRNLKKRALNSFPELTNSINATGFTQLLAHSVRVPLEPSISTLLYKCYLCFCIIILLLLMRNISSYEESDFHPYNLCFKSRLINLTKRKIIFSQSPEESIQK